MADTTSIMIEIDAARAREGGREVETAFSRMKRSSTDLEGSVGTLSKAALKFSGIMLGLGAASDGMRAIMRSIVSGTKTSITSFGDFETELTNMTKVTERELEAIKTEIMLLPPEIGNATDLMKGYYQTISAGVTNPVQALDTLTEAAKAANAAHESQSEVIKVGTKIMAGFRGEVKNMSEAMDLLFAIEKQGQTSFKELVPVMGDLAGLSREVGVSTDELGASLSLITQTSGSTSEAATKYKAILTGLYKPTEQLIKITGGLFGRELINQWGGLAGTLERIKKEAAQAGIPLGKLFESKEALIGVAALAANNFENFNTNLEEMEKRTGASDRAFSNFKGTFKEVRQTFDNTIKKLFIELGERLAPTVVEKMREFTDWIRNNQSTITWLVETVGVVAEKVADIGMFPLKALQSMIDPLSTDEGLTDITLKIKELEETYLRFSREAAEFPTTWRGGAYMQMMSALTDLNTEHAKVNDWLTKNKTVLDALRQSYTAMAVEWDRANSGAETVIQNADETAKKLDELRAKIRAESGKDTMFAGLAKSYQSWVTQMERKIELTGLDEAEKKARLAALQIQDLKVQFAAYIEKNPEAAEEIKRLVKELTRKTKAFEDQNKKMEEQARVAEAVDQISKNLIREADEAAAAYKEWKEEMEFKTAVAGMTEANKKAAEHEKLVEQILIRYAASKEVTEEAVRKLISDWERANEAARRHEEQVERNEEAYREYQDSVARAAETFQQIATDVFIKIFDGSKNIFEGILDLFKRLLASMLAEALTANIFIPVYTQVFPFSGGAGGQPSSVSQYGLTAGIPYLNNVTEFLSSPITPYTYSTTQGAMGSPTMTPGFFGNATWGGAAGSGIAGYGIGSMFGGYGGIGGALGGIGGYLGGAALGASIGGIFGTIGGPVGMLLGAILGGLLGSLFGSSDEPPNIEVKPDPDSAYGLDIDRHDTDFSRQDISTIKKGVTEFFTDFEDIMITTWDDLLTGAEGVFDEKIWSDTVEGATAEIIAKFAVQNAETMFGPDSAFVQYAQNAEEEFGKLATEGETYLDVVIRIMAGLAAIPDAMDSIDEAIEEILEVSPVRRLKDDLGDLENDITDAWDELKEAADPGEAVQKAQELQSLILKRYQMEYDAVMELQAAIETLEANIEAAQRAMDAWTMNIDQQIGQLTGGSEGLFNVLQGQTISAWNDYLADPNMTQLNLVTDLLWQSYNAQSAMITESYTSQISELQGLISAIQTETGTLQQSYQDRIDDLREEQDLIRGNYQTRIDALEDELALARQWASIIDSIGDQLLDMQTDWSNQVDIFERMDILRSEIERIQGLYAGATGTEQAEYASQLQGLYGDLLQMGQEAWQRPSPQYQALYEEVYNALTGLQSDALALGLDEQAIEQKIIDETKEMNKALDAIDIKIGNLKDDLDTELGVLNDLIADYEQQIYSLETDMAADLTALDEQMAEFLGIIKEEGIKLQSEEIENMETELIGLRADLKELIGDDSVEDYIDTLKRATVRELQTIQEILESQYEFWTGEDYPGPADKTPAYAVMPVSSDVRVTVNVNGARDPKVTAREIEKVLARSMRRGGEIAQAVDERVRYAARH